MTRKSFSSIQENKPFLWVVYLLCTIEGRIVGLCDKCVYGLLKAIYVLNAKILSS